jgi:hypothetical protein
MDNFKTFWGRPAAKLARLVKRGKGQGNKTAQTVLLVNTPSTLALPVMVRFPLLVVLVVVGCVDDGWWWWF